MNVPNAMSLFRIVLIPVFAVLYLLSDRHPGMIYWAVGSLVLSGITDTLDGVIARKFHQITDLGKLLDPLADKLTQLTVVICLTVRMHKTDPVIIYLLVICLVKELCQVLGGLFLILRGAKIHGARWYGKVSTFIFYGVMALIALWKGMPGWLTFLLITIVAGLMLFAFFNYMRIFFSIKKTMPEKKSAPSDSDNVKTD